MITSKFLQEYADPMYAEKKSLFYKHKSHFIGVRVPQLRVVAKKLEKLGLEETAFLLHSPMHEERLLALLIWVIQFKKKSQAIYDAYVRHIEYVNNWDLVDASAYQIAGAYLYAHPFDKEILYKWVESRNLWIRRIAVVATLAFIKKGEIEETFLISEKLLHDKEDLIHKAIGWMLREVGKKNENALEVFLKQYLKLLPRTTLRYATERFEKAKKEKFLRA